jgi:hypothetical protein
MARVGSVVQHCEFDGRAIKAMLTGVTKAGDY